MTGHSLGSGLSDLTLRLLNSSDIPVIKSWPPYPKEFSGLDYALRDDGWLDHRTPDTGSMIFVGEINSEPIGFSILTRESGTCPEFLIAIHPDCLGKGYGRELTCRTLAHGFFQLGFSCIRLIVRKNNYRAQKLYEDLGFVRAGECVETIQGNEIEFYRMELTKQSFEEGMST